MNYNKIYKNLIDNAANRMLECYTEKHHIVPRCMGGTDNTDNLVDLTPEEHFLEHQLLVKIYPDHHGLVKAASMMCVTSEYQCRNNKQYGWLRRKLSEVMSASQTGSGNSQYGKQWIHNKELQACKKILKTEPVPSGWELGRVINWNKVNVVANCAYCGL